MSFFDLDCIGGNVEVIAFSDCFKSYGSLIEEGTVLFIKGKPSDSTTPSELKVISDEIIPVKGIRNRLSQRLNINFFKASSTPEVNEIENLMELAKKYPGNCGMIFHLENGSSKRAVKVLAHNIKVSTDKLFIRNLRTKYGKENIWVD